MATQFGLTPQGFVVKQQSDIITEITASLQAAFGSNINLLPQSVFGQIVNIFSEREALIWQLAEAVYSSQYPAGAEGTSVDNILALNGLSRLPARPTKTSPEENGVFGLLLFGTAGTLIPAGSFIDVANSTPVIQFALDADVTIAAAVNDLQTLFFTNTPTTGAFSLSIVDRATQTLTTGSMPWNSLAAQSQISFSGIPVTGNFQIALSKAGVVLTTANIPFGANAAAVQSAITGLAGYSGATVTGSYAAGFVITWGSNPNPLISIPVNTLGVTVFPVNSIQAQINNLHDVVIPNYPYTDVVVSGSFTTGFIVSFGAGTPVSGQPPSGSSAQNVFVVVSNSLQNGMIVTNINPVETIVGAPAQAPGSATCTVDGPTSVLANTLTVIASPVSGWTGVTNPLDCIPGANLETDTEALDRRATLLAAKANGPLQSIVEKVSQVLGVTASIGFENLTEAALQVISFSAVPVTGNFKIQFGAQTTANIPFSASSANVQSAIRALSGLSAVNVIGSFFSGFTIDFNGSFGGQPQALVTIPSNTLSVSATPSFGRPGKSFEIVVQGGNDTEIAQAIYDSKPAGIQSYGNTSQIILDSNGNPHPISFSRPTLIPIYFAIGIHIDPTKFPSNGVQTIQAELVALGNTYGIGGLIVGFGTDGLVGAFNNVPGIISYTIAFDRIPNPTQNANIQLQAEEVGEFESFNIVVQFT